MYFFFGSISYSLYLYHQPVFSIYRNLFGINLTLFEIIFLILLSIALGYLSYKHVEKTIKKIRSNKLKSLKLLIIGYSTILIFIALASTNANWIKDQWRSNVYFGKSQAYNLVSSNLGVSVMKKEKI